MRILTFRRKSKSENETANDDAAEAGVHGAPPQYLPHDALPGNGYDQVALEQASLDQASFDRASLDPAGQYVGDPNLAPPAAAQHWPDPQDPAYAAAQEFQALSSQPLTSSGDSPAPEIEGFAPEGLLYGPDGQPLQNAGAVHQPALGQPALDQGLYQDPYDFPEDAGIAVEHRPDASEVDDPHSGIEPVPGEGWLTVQGVQKSYGKRLVVKGVSLSVRRGESVGLLGPNGAGKTTVFYMITGLVPADAGQIFIDGRDVTPLPMYRRARLGIGYLPQEASIFRGLTVEQNIMAVLELIEPNKKKRHEQLDSLLEEFRITRLRKSPSIALSGGERRRCEIARALATRPHFMLLDEPFAGIDPIAVGDIQELVRHLTQRGIGVLITDHNVRETLSLIDRAYIVFDGQILTQGNPDEIINNEEVRRVYLGDMFG